MTNCFEKKETALVHNKRCLFSLSIILLFSLGSITGSLYAQEASLGVSGVRAKGDFSNGIDVAQSENVGSVAPQTPSLNPNGVWGEQLGEGNAETNNGFSNVEERSRDYANQAIEESASATSNTDDEANVVPGPQTWFNSERGWFGPESVATSLKTLLVMSLLSLAPAIFLMTTSYIRVSVVLAFLRQALGAGQVPSNQVIAGLSIFLTILIMAPVWTEVYEEAVVPYSAGEIGQAEALNKGGEPIRNFLWKQIERTGNVEIVAMFSRYSSPDQDSAPEYYEDVPWRALAPAFVLSELKTAFLIGFQVLLPFLIIDLVVSCALVSSGMMMLPPAIVSLPFKLALFVLVDGWTLTIKSLLESFVQNS